MNWNDITNYWKWELYGLLINGNGDEIYNVNISDEDMLLVIERFLNNDDIWNCIDRILLQYIDDIKKEKENKEK